MLAVPVGLLATAILMVNNVRDLETDRRAGKRTLAVRLGARRARARLYAATVYVAFLTAPVAWLAGGEGLSAWLLLPWLALPLAAPVVRTVRNRVDGPSLNGALAKTGMLQLVFCVLLSAGLLRRADAHGPPGRAPTARPAADGLGRAARARARCTCGWTSADGDYGEGEAAPLEPYDGVRSPPCAPRSTPTPQIDAPPEEPAGGLPARARPAAGAGGDRPRAVGPRRARRAGTPIAPADLHPTRSTAVPVNATIGAEDRAGAAAEAAARGRAGASRCVKVKVGIGDDAGRVAAVRAAAPDVADPRRRQRRVAHARARRSRTCARSRRSGSSCARSRSTASRRCARVRDESPVPIAMDETLRAGAPAPPTSCA